MLYRQLTQSGPQELDQDDLDSSFEEYCTDIADTAAWGGQTELNAVANVLQHHIKVYAAGLPVVDMGQQFQGMCLMFKITSQPCCVLTSNAVVKQPLIGFCNVSAYAVKSPHHINSL